MTSMLNETKMDENRLPLEDEVAKEHEAADLLFLFSDDNLYRCFHHTTWNKLTVKGRLCLLQEFENRQAKLDGRKPITIKVGKLPGNVIGRHTVYPNGAETITIDVTVLKNSGLSAYTAADALDTVIHEGRHSFQHNSILNHSDKVPERIRLEWSAVMGEFGGKYTSGQENFLIYVMQSIEMDARRFARRRVQEIGDRLTAMGCPDAHFSLTNAKLLAQEKFLLEKVRKTFKMEDIDAYEQRVLDFFRHNRPELNLEHLKIFDHVRLILQRTDIQSMDALLEILDKQADDAMEGNMDRKIDSKIDKMTNYSDYLPSMEGRFHG